MNSMTDDKLESNYKGNALLHLLSYMKPYAGWVTLCLVLVLALTGFDLYRPTLIYSIAIFGGIAFTALPYFIFMKGLGKSPYLPAEVRDYIDQ